MKGFSISMVFVLIGAVLVCADTPSWKTNYEKGLSLQAQGKYQSAIDYLRMAAADKPISEIMTEKSESLEYLPYLQIGICYYQLGKVQLAREFLDLESNLAAIAQSRAGKDLMKQYRTKLETSSPQEEPDTIEDSIRNYKSKGYLLSKTEVSELKEQIRQRCKLPRADEKTYPWYYHYELGLAMEHRNDWQRALESFLHALDDRDQPKKFSRIYGMWYVDYYPYYNIGLAHYHLRNWECAANSFKLSELLEDIPRGTEEQREMEGYKGEIEKNLAEPSSNH